DWQGVISTKFQRKGRVSASASGFWLFCPSQPGGSEAPCLEYLRRRGAEPWAAGNQLKSLLQRRTARTRTPIARLAVSAERTQHSAMRSSGTPGSFSKRRGARTSASEASRVIR